MSNSAPPLSVVSLLPSATEMVAELGLLGQLKAVSHVCDFPEAARELPVITKSIVPPGLSSEEIDSFVSAALRDGRSLYEVDEEMLERLEPDVVLTQALCDVCAINYETVARTIGRLDKQPQLVSLNPSCIEDILSDLLRVGEALHVKNDAERIVGSARERLSALSHKLDRVERPSVLTLEWYEPPFFGGHWVPEQVALGGGESAIGKPGERSVRLNWEQVSASDPDVIILMPCGYNLEKTLELTSELKELSQWQELRAVRDKRVFAVDANGCFSRPSLRVVQGAEVIGHVLHPDRVAAPTTPDLFAPFFGDAS